MEGTEGRGLVASRVGILLWLLTLYVGLTYLAVGTISVSQINSRFGDQAAIIFHVADLADQQRRVRNVQMMEAETIFEQTRMLRDGALVELAVHSERLGLSQARLRKALDDPDQSVRLEDLGIKADAETNKVWDTAVAEYYRQNLFNDLAKKRRDHLMEMLRGGLAALVGDVPQDGKVFGLSETQFQTAAATAAGLRAFGYAWLFAIPAEVLTLVLALVLGALGGTLHMTKVTIDGDEMPPGLWYLFRPCQGVLMALVVFVLLKAGQLTMGAADNDTLNPYFVAFVGTVSGLLSPDAYRLVQRAGASLIPAGDDESDRWAIGLAQAMQDNSIDAATLAQGIGVRIEDLTSWMAETAPVPVAQQRVVAAWLHADPRRLFTTDRPPQMVVSAPTSPPVALAS